MNDKDLDKLFQEHLERHSVRPRNNIWHQIENRLDQKKVVPVRRLSWISYAAMAVGCLGLITLLYNTMTLKEDASITAQTEIPTTAVTNTGRESSNLARTVIPVIKEQVERSEQEVTKKEEFMQMASISEKKDPVNEHLSLTEEPRVELVGLEPAGVSVGLTAGLDMDVDDKAPQKYAISVPPVAPLIDSPETEESMLASTRKPTEGIVPTILNKISDALNPTDNTTVQFSKDEEGFLRLDVVNSFVKNRNKKRR
ncbi:hypothetical protein [Sphingobacterium haloxyli]|uniref:Uncharacterized protein n=1 Tax=Sphingobacterium haloxyli TaxID=2100533 RepID=A0A2S9J0W1_9SPHI|nr:hypothetical protein [Sphingobacterium haloxyli]PRD46411.1 hypothetical protein C5745_15675 [Sphingobacterium haloxyli]